jgi:hypothetical protein
MAKKIKKIKPEQQSQERLVTVAQAVERYQAECRRLPAI